MDQVINVAIIQNEIAFLPVDGATTRTHPCTNEIMNVDVNSLLLLLPPTQATWDKKDLSTKFFSNPTAKKLLPDYSSPTTLFNLFFDDEVVEYVVKMANLYAHQEKGKHLFNIDQSEMRLTLQFYCHLDTTYLHFESCILGK